jgi:hypothetical protein
MNRWIKLGIVLAGYPLALLVSIVAVAIYDRQFTAADNQQMGGMIAGGEMMYGAGVFLLLAAIPTGLGLWFVRTSRSFWTAISNLSIGFAAIGLASAAVSLTIRTAPDAGWLALLAFLGIVQMMSSPIWLSGFALFAFLAPAHDLRQRMLVAAAIEVLVAACGAIHFLPAYLP